MSIQVKELAFIFHAVTDVPRARKFYEGLLGLKPSVQVEFSPGTWWVEYDIAGQALAITNSYPGKPAAAVALEVTDIDASHQAVQASGYPIVTKLTETRVCRMLQVSDPDGNVVTLHQRKAR